MPDACLLGIYEFVYLLWLGQSIGSGMMETHRKVFEIERKSSKSQIKNGFCSVCTSGTQYRKTSRFGKTPWKLNHFVCSNQ